jgi:hypothetical protein
MLKAMESISSGVTRGTSASGQQTVHAQIRVIADFQVQVGGFVFHRAAEEIVNAYGHNVLTPQECSQ